MTEKEFTNIIKRQRYIGGLFAYGFITLCYLIDKYEKEQNFEECQIIYDCIQKVNTIRGLDLPTKYNDESWQYFLDAMGEFGFKGHTSANNLPYYADELEKEIKSINTFCPQAALNE